MHKKDKAINSVNRLTDVYAQIRADKEEKKRKFQINLGTALVVVAIIGIISTIL